MNLGSEIPPTRVGVDRRIAEIAACQHGVVAIRQLWCLGLGQGGLDRRVASGRLHSVHHGVYAVGHPVLAREGRWMAAVLAGGEEAVLSHASAAALWDIQPTLRSRIDVTAPTRAGRCRRRGIALHRSGTLTPDQMASVRGIPVTTVARTILDIAAGSSVGALERAIHAAEMAGVYDGEALARLLEAHPRRAGTRVVRACMGLRVVAATRSGLEARFLDLCDRNEIERPLVNTVVAGHEVDFLWAEARLVVETDGYRYHGDRSAFERDRSRDARLAVAGYHVLRFSYRQVTQESEAVAHTILSLLARGARLPSNTG